MEKPAETAHPIHDLIARRWSPRAFDERPVEPEKLKSLFEAARWAPSSNNEQPWRFVVTSRQDAPTEHDRLLACLTERNRTWAFRAPILILSVASLNFEDDGKVNRHAYHDTGMAVGNLLLHATPLGELLLQATPVGIQVRQMAGFDDQKARETAPIPPFFDPDYRKYL